MGVMLLKFGRYFMVVIVFIVILIALANLIFEKSYPFSASITYGVTFTPKYARYLKLDWQKTYLQILDDLKIKNLRLPSYWDVLEREAGSYDFSETDFMLDEAQKRGVRALLVVGVKQPRWPECHIPAWAKALSPNERRGKALRYVRAVVERYKDNPSIWAWQVENEPFVSWFGENCGLPDKQFIKDEIELIKRSDAKRPVVITDSGEWSSWVPAMKSSDILGISLYRKSHNQVLNLYTTYPFPTGMYLLKSTLVRKLFAPDNQKTIISELQAEPWTQKAVPDTSFKEQEKLFSVQDFKENIEYARKTGFDEVYLWGVEWWYYMAKHGLPQYLDYAKDLLNMGRQS